MVDITGHPPFGLPFALLTWYVRDGRVSVGVVALAAVAALLPNIDLVRYDAARFDYGFFAVMVGTHLGVASLTTPADRRHRRRPL